MENAREIYVLSYLDYLKYHRTNTLGHHVLISLRDTNDDRSVFRAKSDCKDVITLYFDDIVTNTKDLILMNNEHVKALYNFILKHKSCERFVVHCAFGQSRSAAIGQVIKEQLGGKLICINRININPYVYNTLTKEFKNRSKLFSVVRELFNLVRK